MYKKYSEFLNTIGELYITKVKSSTITSRLRKYNSSLEKEVDHDDATINVYNALIEAVHKNLNVNHEFMKIKKDLLGKDEMHLYDIYVNPIEVEDDNICYEEASKQVLDALSVIGEEYVSKLKEAFANNSNDNITLVYFKYGKHDPFYNATGDYGKNMMKKFSEELLKYCNKYLDSYKKNN